MHALFFSALALVAAPVAQSSKTAPSDGTFHLEREAKSLRSLQLTSNGGDIRIRGHRSSQVIVEGARSLGSKSCGVKLRSKGTTLFVAATDPQGRPCLVDLQVKVPQAMDLDLHGGTGNVFVSGLRAGLRIDLAQGNAVLGGVFNKFHAHLGEGSLSVQGLAGASHVEAEHGNVQMFVAPEAHDKELALDFQVGTGNVTVVAPHKEASVVVDCSEGQVKNGLEDGGVGSKLTIKGHIDHGNFMARRGG